MSWPGVRMRLVVSETDVPGVSLAEFDPPMHSAVVWDSARGVLEGDPDHVVAAPERHAAAHAVDQRRDGRGRRPEFGDVRDAVRVWLVRDALT